jgi:hypothetical protein
MLQLVKIVYMINSVILSIATSCLMTGTKQLYLLTKNKFM